MTTVKHTTVHDPEAEKSLLEKLDNFDEEANADGILILGRGRIVVRQDSLIEEKLFKNIDEKKKNVFFSGSLEHNGQRFRKFIAQIDKL